MSEISNTPGPVKTRLYATAVLMQQSSFGSEATMVVGYLSASSKIEATGSAILAAQKLNSSHVVLGQNVIEIGQETIDELATPVPVPAANWISVSDRLPAEGDIVHFSVLGFVTSGVFRTKNTFYGPSFVGANHSFPLREAEVTHWMPIPFPAPPTE